MFKSKLWIGVALLLGVVVILGVSDTTSYLRGIRHGVKKFLSQNTSTSLDISRIETLLDKEADKIMAFQGEVAGLDEKITGEKDKVRRILIEITNQKDALKQARIYLAEDKEVYYIDKERSKHEIEVDADGRMEFVYTLTQQLDLSNSLIVTLEQTSVACKSNLINAKGNIMAKRMQLEELKAREMNAEIQAKARALSDSLVGLSDSLLKQSQLQEAMKIYEQKIAKKERAAGDITDKTSPWIDYSPEEKQGPTVKDKIDELLS